ncbi:MAG: endonuclease/exonuclease/phosphatase family protein [Kiritimatiellia bacterium]
MLLIFSLSSLSCRGAEPYPDLLPIGLIRGEVPPAGDATQFRARLDQETVVIRGLLYQILCWRSSKGEDIYGGFIQNIAKDADGDPNSSDGIFVYMGRRPVLPADPQGDYHAKVGDLITLRGMVNERYGQTEFSDARVLQVQSGLDVNKLLPPVKLELPDALGDRQRLLEKLEGMRVMLSPGAVAVSGTHPQFRTYDSQLWVIPSDHPAARREDPATRRIYRPAHPLSTHTAKEGHGKFLVIGSLGLPGKLENRDLFLPPVYAGAVLEDAVTGGIQYSWGEYVLLTEKIPDFEGYEKPSSQLPKDEKSSAAHLRIAAYNVENLYDFVDDPFDDCDFQDDPGCPGSRFPLNYVPPSPEVFQARIRKLAAQIINDLHAPDILMIQEAEDQDIGRLQSGRMVYTEKNDADGQTDGLQELALEIMEQGGPAYEVLVDRDGADDRGIICAWMVRTERLKPVDPARVPEFFGREVQLPSGIEWLPVSREISNPKAFNAVFTGTPDNASEMTAVFSRAVQVLLLEDVQTGERIWLQNNHFSSGPDRRIDRRKAQAGMNAELSQMIRALDPGALLIVGGDLNVFPRPDDPLDPPSDQLAALYEADLYNVIDRIMPEDPARAYSYIYQGVAGTLDHFFLSPQAKERLRFAAYLKLNAGAPETFPEFPPQRASDHDPLLIELEWGEGK